jgi:hypothetical protein
VKRFIVIADNQIVGIFIVFACAEIYARGLKNTCIEIVDML